MGEAQAARRELVANAGIPWHALRLESKVSLSGVRSVRSVVRAFRPDIIHSFTGRALSTALFAAYGTRTRHVAYRGTAGHLSRWDPSSWITFLNPRVRMIVCVSEAVRSYLLSVGVAPERTRTIYKGHACAWYASSQKPSLAPFGMPFDAFPVGYAANMRPDKGADVLLEAQRLLPATSPLHVLMIGEVRDPAVRALAQEPLIAERAHFTGYRPDAAQLLGACRVTVMPSREREGFPKAVLEGMAQGVCPVVSRVGGMPELVIHEQCGLLVPPGDAAALMQALDRLAQDRELCSRLGARAKERIEKDFTITATIAAHIELYSELMRE